MFSAELDKNSVLTREGFPDPSLCMGERKFWKLIMCFSNKTRLDVSYSVIVGFRRVPILWATVVVKNKAYPVPCFIKKQNKTKKQ